MQSSFGTVHLSLHKLLKHYESMNFMSVAKLVNFIFPNFYRLCSTLQSECVLCTPVPGFINGVREVIGCNKNLWCCINSAQNVSLKKTLKRTSTTILFLTYTYIYSNIILMVNTLTLKQQFMSSLPTFIFQ